MQVAISRWRVSVSSNQEPFLFNRQLISADNIYYQLINSTVYQTKAQQSPLSIIYMNYGFKKEKSYQYCEIKKENRLNMTILVFA